MDLEIEYPILFRHFMMGQFLVQIREGGKSNTVSPDISRSSIGQRMSRWAYNSGQIRK
jgi:hypothetical protein